MKTIENRKDKGFSIGAICEEFRLKRDAYYKYQKRYTTRDQLEKTVVRLVNKSRRTLPW
jgi:hypothetical protein